MLREKFYNAQAFEHYSHQAEQDGQRCILLVGEILHMAPAGLEHGDIASELNMLIRQYVKQHNLGRVTTAETGYILHRDPEGRDTVLAPDVGFASWERAAEGSEGFAPYAPELAVEVISPGDRASVVQAKVLSYLQYGTHLVWLVYPRTRTVVVHDPAGVATLTSDDVLEGGSVLPGFRVKVGEIFPTR